MRVIQANLQRSKLATAELLQSAKEKGVSIALVQEPYVGKSGVLKQHSGTQVIQCTLNRQKPVKAAIIIFGDRLEVIHDPQLVTETEAAVLLVAGKLKIGVVSVYFDGDEDIEPYLRRTQAACRKLDTNNIIVAGDVNAWSHWWGSNSENERGAAYNNFLNEMEFQILNAGDTPTFETFRGGRVCSSIVDVTACSLPLLGKIERWRVDRGLTTSDHNAITFTLRLDAALEPLQPCTTRRYNTKKANWSDFSTHFSNALAEKSITPETINKVETSEDLDSIITEYTNAIQESCEKSIPKIGTWKGKARPPWWSQTLKQLQRDTLKKKRRIRNAAPHRREAVIDEYLQAKNAYTSKVNESQTESWKDFCTTQEKESMWDGIYRVIRRTARRHEDMLLRSADGNTLSPEQSAELLAKTFYPEDSVESDLPYHTQLRELVEETHLDDTTDLSENDPPFNPAELELVLSAQNPKKAPGPDGLTADICIAAIRCARKTFMAIANKCLSLAHFPTQWKTAHVVIIRKPGKDDYTHPKSYRPIGLLPVLGKIIEKLMVGRLQWHILPTLNNKQYGFMPQRGTEDALYDLVKHVKEEIERKKIVLIVSLDIEGAFDNAWWPALKQQLKIKNTPKNLFELVISYLKNRRIVVNYARATSEKETTKGCVQGSIGGPTFWNIILDSLLQKMNDEQVYCQAFADDVVLVFSDHSVNTLEEVANASLETVVQWGTQNKLNFAPHKTNAMLLTRKLKYDPPTLYMSGKKLNLVEELKLLGLIIDRKLNFKSHMSATCKKAADIYKQLAHAAKVTWGLNGEITRTIYLAVIEPIVMYASSVWSPTTDLQMVKDQLNTLQRGFAQKICKAYRTVSLTSALTLSGLLPLDLRIQEAASLYEAKKKCSQDYLPPDKELEQNIGYLEHPHPSSLIPTEYELLENMDPETLDAHQITGPQIYTDGSKIEGKVGAALTWWEKGRESRHSTFSLDPSCTVFQSELYALHRAVQLVKTSKEPIVNILSDSRSSLDLLKNPKQSHPLSQCIKENIGKIRAEGRDIRLFWLRAHVGTAGNERADELAKTAALKPDTTPDYDKIPLSYVKRKIREESVRKWQARYETSSTGSVTKTFLPYVDRAYRIMRKTKPTPTQVQVLTGHGGIAEYLHRFKLKDSPGCECDPNISESVWHIILECPRFLATRQDLEASIDTKLEKQHLHYILDNANKRPQFLEYAETAFRIAAKRNSSTNLEHINPNSTQTSTTASDINCQRNPNTTSIGNAEQAAALHRYSERQLLKCGEPGQPGIRVRGVALFMDNNAERFGISFCNAMARDRKSRSVTISPGLSALLNGSTSKITMKRKTYNALTEIEVANQRCRLVRSKNKTIALFEGSTDKSSFTQACHVLASFGETGGSDTETPYKISVDAMAVGYEKGEVADRVGCIKASELHEVIVYENRGENLDFLKTQTPAPKTATTPPHGPGLPNANPQKSGSEKLQESQQTASEEAAARQWETRRRKEAEGTSMANTLIRVVTDAVQRWIPGGARGRTQGIQAVANERTSKSPKRKPPKPQTTRTRAEMGQVKPPNLRNVSGPLDHIVNAFLEFQAVTKATREVNMMTCKNIMQSYHLGAEGLLEVRLKEADATIYNNDTSQVIKGIEISRHMAAFSATGGFVALDEEETQKTGREKFKTPTDDPIVVTARCTKVMLDDRILEMAETASRDLPSDKPFKSWEVPKITWVNGVPGCGKTTWIVNNFVAEGDIVVTTTCEAAKDLREKLAQRMGADAKSKVRTMASMLVNGLRESENDRCKRLIVDEALMNHFGAIVMATRLTKAGETILIGDINQLPYIDRENLFKMAYNRPTLVATINQELLCTHRNPMDVAYALSEIYSGIYSSKSCVHSLKLEKYTGSRIPQDSKNTLFLVHTQAEKETLISKGYGSGEGSRTLTIHEAQGLTYETVVIVRTTARRQQLHESVPHAVVAVSRHTVSCVYYTDDGEDATGRFVRRAMTASTKEIMSYNAKMAMKRRDTAVVEAILEKWGRESK